MTAVFWYPFLGRFRLYKGFSWAEYYRMHGLWLIHTRASQVQAMLFDMRKEVYL